MYPTRETAHIMILQEIQLIEIPEGYYGKPAQYLTESLETRLIRIIRKDPRFKLEGPVPIYAVARAKGHAGEGQFRIFVVHRFDADRRRRGLDKFTRIDIL